MQKKKNDLMLRPVNKTDHMQQGVNALAWNDYLVADCLQGVQCNVL